MTFDFARRSRPAAEPSRQDGDPPLGRLILARARLVIRSLAKQFRFDPAALVALMGLAIVCVGFSGCRPKSAPPATSSPAAATSPSEATGAEEPEVSSLEAAAPDVAATMEADPIDAIPAQASLGDGDSGKESPSDVPVDPQRTPTEDMPSTQSEASESAAAMEPASPAEQGGPLTQAELDEEYVPDPEIMAEIEAQRKALRRLADTYGPPPGAVQLGAQPDLWVDMKAKRIYVDGYVSMRRGPLEMLACPVGTKEHESVVALFAKSNEVHAALLAIGAESGTTARWDPEFKPPTGQTVSVWVMYRNEKETPQKEVIDAEDSRNRYRPFVPGDQAKVVDARRWVRNVKTKEALAEPWVFAGSEFWTDPVENVEHYSANAGDMICVSNFSTAMMDVPFASSADAGNTLFEPFTERIPEQGTPVRVVLVPQPDDGDETERSIAPEQPPQAAMLPLDDSSQVEEPPSAEPQDDSSDAGS